MLPIVHVYVIDLKVEPSDDLIDTLSQQERERGSEAILDLCVVWEVM